ncbi:MAG TPA: hypothetical protein DDY29_10425 [Rhodobacteraceae bacterium]|jgi:hypothetical protein|nr:hypothetical protein [Paracoccaceae bacterium]HBG99106.1 hypothetical protein [Paracoccaceae bacterium]
MKPALSALLALAAAWPAQAQSPKFVPPQGCDAYLTVQMKGCLVSHYFTCQGDPEGHRWGATLTADGPVALSYLDAEYQWLQTMILVIGMTETLREPSQDPASFSELLETGLDSFDFETVTSGAIDGQVHRYQGFDRLTGETVEIDGEPLMVTEFEVRESVDGQVIFTRQGNQYVSERFGLFLGGIETETDGVETVENDRTPVQFIEPGEPGFLDARPIFDCGAVLSRAPADIVPARLLP